MGTVEDKAPQQTQSEKQTVHINGCIKMCSLIDFIQIVENTF